MVAEVVVVTVGDVSDPVGADLTLALPGAGAGAGAARPVAASALPGGESDGVFGGVVVVCDFTSNVTVVEGVEAVVEEAVLPDCDVDCWPPVWPWELDCWELDCWEVDCWELLEVLSAPAAFWLLAGGFKLFST